MRTRDDYFPVSVQHAAEQAEWWIRYAYDRLGSDGRTYHPGVQSHLESTRTHIRASVHLAQPEQDQRREPDPHRTLDA
jgi:hypothetical protein